MATTRKVTKHTGRVLPTDRLLELPAHDTELEADVLYCLFHSSEPRKRINRTEKRVRSLVIGMAGWVFALGRPHAKIA